MEIRNVTMEDGRACAALIHLIKSGKWELTGTDAEALVITKKWIHDLAMEMAKQLRPKDNATPLVASASPAPQTMKVTAMGPIGSTPSKKKQKKK